MKKKVVVSFNIFLAVIIILFVYFRFHNVDVSIEFEYNAESPKLIDVFEKTFAEKIETDKLYLLFVFNRLPTLEDLETIEKLSRKYKEDTAIRALFTEKFNSSSPIDFNHRFATNYKIKCRKDNSLLDQKYFLMLKGRKFVYADSTLGIQEIAMLIQGNLFPEKGYSDYAASISDLRERIRNRIEQAPLNLFNIKKSQFETVSDLAEKSEIQFFHSNCSSCALKTILSNIRLQGILSKKEAVFIFSALGSSVLIKKLLNEKSINARIYVDRKDEFDLLTAISQDMDKPIIVDLKNKEKMK